MSAAEPSAPSTAPLPGGDGDDLPEVARIARDLIRFDPTNYGEGRANGEREAAEYVGTFLASLGLEPEYYEPIPRRTPDAVAAATGPAAGFLRSTFRTTTNPTGLEAGYKHNVIPDAASAAIDVRTLPGQEDLVLAEIQRIVGDDIVIDIAHRDIGLEVPFSGDLVEAMVAALGRHDPGVPVVPYLMGGGTDNKALAELGIAGYGFAPLRLPDDLDFTGMFHGVDERVPIDALVFGQRVLTDLLRTY